MAICNGALLLVWAAVILTQSAFSLETSALEEKKRPFDSIF